MAAMSLGSLYRRVLLLHPDFLKCPTLQAMRARQVVQTCRTTCPQVIWADLHADLGGWGSAEAQQALALNSNLPQKQDMINDVELYGKVRLWATRTVHHIVSFIGMLNPSCYSYLTLSEPYGLHPGCTQHHLPSSVGKLPSLVCSTQQILRVSTGATEEGNLGLKFMQPQLKLSV